MIILILPQAVYSFMELSVIFSMWFGVRYLRGEASEALVETPGFRYHEVQGSPPPSSGRGRFYRISRNYPILRWPLSDVGLSWGEIHVDGVHQFIIIGGLLKECSRSRLQGPLLVALRVAGAEHDNRDASQSVELL